MTYCDDPRTLSSPSLVKLVCGRLRIFCRLLRFLLVFSQISDRDVRDRQAVARYAGLPDMQESEYNSGHYVAASEIVASVKAHFSKNFPF